MIFFGLVGGFNRPALGFQFTRFRPDSDVLDELGIEEREAEKLVLIQVHHEELVGRRQVQFLGRELLVKVADVFAMFLLTRQPTTQKEYSIRIQPSFW